MIQIECKNLTLGYEGRPVVSNLNFSAHEGDYICIVGENGSGKSTLIKALLALHAPLSGSISFADGRKAGEIGYLPQQTQVQRDFPASVREIVLSGFEGRRRPRPFYSAQEKESAVKAMQRLGVEALEKRSYRTLSGGQQQRVLLARALCAAQKILLLDEPTTGLDPKVTVQMYDLIASLNQKDGITIIMVSHDLSAAERYASHVLHIGNTPFFGTRDEYLKSGIWHSFTGEGRQI